MKITGLNNVLRQLDQLSRKAETEVNQAVDQSGEDVLQSAKSNTDSEQIRTSLVKASRTENGSYIVNIGTDLLIAPYHEFGTGSNVFTIVNSASGFTSEDRTYANEFYVNGEGYKFARPYLLPAYYKHRRELADKINQLLGNLVR